jgi:hypothetical protein
LDGILRKLRLSAPWYDLPPCAGDYYPSWQTCYRRYRRWQRAGLMDRIYRLLYQDLCDRAGIDLFKLLQVAGNSAQGPNSPLGQGVLTLSCDSQGWQLDLPADLEDSWQGSTIHLLVQVILAHLKQNHCLPSNRTLTIQYFI